MRTYGSISIVEKQIDSKQRPIDGDRSLLDYAEFQEDSWDEIPSFPPTHSIAVPVKKGTFISIDKAEPHVCIKLKAIFPKIARSSTLPYLIPFTPENCHDILWFIERYPLEMQAKYLKKLRKGDQLHIDHLNAAETIFLPDYKPQPVVLNPGFEARDYQLRGYEMGELCGRLLIGDEMGLGKTLIAILMMTNPANRPAAVVCQAHLPTQWENEITRFTPLTVHKITKSKAYDLPPADVYIFKYTSLLGWVDLFSSGFFKLCVFDEVQELRHPGTAKYSAAKELSYRAEKCIALSGTPIYNYGSEIFFIMNAIKQGCLDSWDAFYREWCHHGKTVADPKALGTYLREKSLFLRRTRVEVGRQLPEINKIVYTIDYDHKEVEKIEDLARELALKVISAGSFVQMGQSARDFDWRLRQATGVAKARYAAAFIKILIDSGEPVVVAAWHREVYEILLSELAAYNPVMYTGSESPTQKNVSFKKFVSGETDCFIISLRSGVGLDGLQHRCRTIVNVELDWSPKVHDQLGTRVDRDGQKDQVTHFFLVCDWGSDPFIMDTLGLKASQSHNIIDPMMGVSEQYSNESRIKAMAEQFLNSRKEKSAPCQ